MIYSLENIIKHIKSFHDICQGLFKKNI